MSVLEKIIQRSGFLNFMEVLKNFTESIKIDTDETIDAKISSIREYLPNFHPQETDEEQEVEDTLTRLYNAIEEIKSHGESAQTALKEILKAARRA